MSPVPPPATASAPLLTARFEVRAMRDLTVHAELRNRASHDLFVCDRLWTLEGGSRPVPDPERVYRFVHGHALRLQLGPCPLPRRYVALFRNLPHVTRVRPGEVLRIELELTGPVREYSFYFPRLTTSGERRVAVKEVELVVQVVPDRPGLDAGDSWLGPPALELRSPEAPRWLEVVSTRSQRVELDVLERTDEIERLYLPGEPKPPL
ncbi:MAG: hypothetical protein AB2L07_17660 [Thermoanaerobaculaceae bacterium]